MSATAAPDAPDGIQRINEVWDKADEVVCKTGSDVSQDDLLKEIIQVTGKTTPSFTKKVFKRYREQFGRRCLYDGCVQHFGSKSKFLKHVRVKKHWMKKTVLKKRFEENMEMLKERLDEDEITSVDEYEEDHLRTLVNALVLKGYMEKMNHN